jgi:glyceraldehyde 3-phosphate dehydrogenase
MATKIAINGFGRIGRLVLRTLLERHKKDLSVVAINELADLKTNAHLFRYDTTYGGYQGSVEVGDNSMRVDGRYIAVLYQREPARLPWKQLGVEIVIESTGVFTDAAQLKAHLDAGAKKVIVTAPATNEHHRGPWRQRGTTTIRATITLFQRRAPPIVWRRWPKGVLHDSFGIERGLMTTTHAYTNDQRILDLAHKDLRRARAAAMNIVPTSTGAAKAIGLVMPELKGKLHGLSLRVPTATVSVVDLVVDLKKTASVEDLNGAFKKAAEGKMKGFWSGPGLGLQRFPW